MHIGDVPDAVVGSVENACTISIELTQTVVLHVPSARTKYIVVVTGLSVGELPVPTSNEPHEPLYQFQVAPLPKVPPAVVNVTEEPWQIVDGFIVSDVGFVELTSRVTVVLTHVVILHKLSALTQYMLVLAGETIIEVPDPKYEPPQDAVYQSQLAPVPNAPPVIDKVELPEQIEAGVEAAEPGEVEMELIDIVVLTQIVVLQSPSALTQYVVCETGETLML